MKKVLIIAAVVVVAAGLYLNQKPDLPEPVAYQSPRHPERNDRGEAEGVEPRDPVDTETPEENTTGLPRSVASGDLPRNDETTPSPLPYQGGGIPTAYNLAVPFQPQAPHANWDLPYQEACEEASLIMAARFFDGESLSADEMDSEIHKLVLWQKENFGHYEDTTAGEVVRIASDYFNLNATLDFDVNAENIKRYVSQNKLVIVPAAGRELPNPYFTGDGPLYHMLVIRGYTATQFITNDPGTRRGREFVYRYNDLINAIHNWPREHGGFKDNVTDEEMRNGQKVLIVVDKGL